MKRETEEDKRCGRKKDEKWLENWKGYEQQIKKKEKHVKCIRIAEGSSRQEKKGKK